MADTRPVLIGMNNPLSDDPAFALWPSPERSTGHRLYSMLSERTGCSRLDYQRTFDRRNASPKRQWDPSDVDRGLWPSLQGRTVLVLGQAVANALWLSRGRLLAWQVTAGVRWCEIPHPSGRNRLYNDEVLSIAVGMRLEQLFEDYREGRHVLY